MPGGRSSDTRAIDQLDRIVARVVEVATDLRPVQLEMVDPAANVAADVAAQRQAARRHLDPPGDRRGDGRGPTRHHQVAADGGARPDVDHASSDHDVLRDWSVDRDVAAGGDDVAAHTAGDVDRAAAED